MEKLLTGLIDVELRSSGGTTLMRQLYDGLRAAILNGALAPGFRLPSSRDLACQLKISRNTVSFVVDQLAMEGYLDVARAASERRRGVQNQVWCSGRAVTRGRSPDTLRLSRWATRLRKSRLAVRKRGRAAAVFSGPG